MTTFLEDLRGERARLKSLMAEMEEGRLVTGAQLEATPDTIRFTKQKIAELSALIATYEADVSKGS